MSMTPNAAYYANHKAHTSGMRRDIHRAWQGAMGGELPVRLLGDRDQGGMRGGSEWTPGTMIKRSLPKLIAYIARCKNVRRRTEAIRQLPWSRMTPQARAIVLKYIPDKPNNRSQKRRAKALIRANEAISRLRQYADYSPQI